MSLFRRAVIYPLGKNGRSSSIILTLLDSIYKTESSDLVDNLSGMDYTNCQEEKCHDGALDRNTARLSIGTAMQSGSEHRKTGRVFSYPSNATFLDNDNFHQITNEIFNNIMTITDQNAQSNCTFPVVFEESAILPANGRNLINFNGNVDCEVYKKPGKSINAHPTAGLTRVKFPRSIHGDLLEEQLIPAFDINWCSLPRLMFCFWLGLAVTGSSG